MAQQAKKKTTGGSVWYAVALARIALGFVFLWAFFDKLFGWGYATTHAHAWVNGGSPTKDFLSGVNGPFANFFHNMAGQGWADWLFMIGLAGIGTALLLGVMVRFAVISGTLLLVMMWAASLPVATNPFLDEHLVYAVVLWVIFLGYPNQVFSFGSWWRGSLGRGRWLW